MRSSGQAACSLVDSPPESEPEPGRVGRRFFGGAGGVLMSPHNGRIDEEFLETVILAGVDPLPQPFPEGVLLPAAEPLVDGIPVPERFEQVAPGVPVRAW